MIDFTPLPPDATEAERNARFNGLMRAVEPFTRIKGQNGVSVHLTEGNVVVEINTKEIAGIVETGGGGGTSGGGGGGDDTGGGNNDSGGSTSGSGTNTGGATSGAGGDNGISFTPGDATTSTATVTYTERARGGTASLVGYAEIASPSTPARKYRTITASGGYAINRYTGGSGCSTPDSTPTSTGTYSGSITYDKTTGLPSGAMQIDASISGIQDISSYTQIDAEPNGAYTRINTKTASYAEIVNGCFNSGVDYRYTLATFRFDLTVEDTAADAIARLMASASWSAWAAASIPASSTTYTSRTTGFTFDYYHRELRAVYAGMPHNWPFRVQIRLVMINLTTSAPSTFFTYNYSLTTDGTGAATWTVPIIPSVPGYDYRVQSVSHFY